MKIILNLSPYRDGHRVRFVGFYPLAIVAGEFQFRANKQHYGRAANFLCEEATIA